MQLPKRSSSSLVEVVCDHCKRPPPSNDVVVERSSSSTTSSSSTSRNPAGLRKQVRRCVLWSVEACVLLLFCVGLVVLVEFVVVHPRPPECDVVSLSLTQFSASTHKAANTSTSITSISSKPETTSNHGIAAAAPTPNQLLTAVIVVTLRASNEIQRIGTFYDHVHVKVLYNGDVVGEGMVGPFFQGRKISNLLQTQVEAHQLPVRHDTGKQLLTDMNDHMVDLQVKVHVLTRVAILKYFIHHFRVHVWCDITVMIASTRLMNSSTLLSKQCRSKD